jgi:hypothetical protein
VEDAVREGSKLWYVPDCWLPTGSSGSAESHEAICVLNAGDQDAHVTMTFYFADREPIRDIRIVVPAERTRHLGMNEPDHIGGVDLPREVGYSIRLESDVPVLVQYTRLDCSEPQMALMTTMALVGD